MKIKYLWTSHLEVRHVKELEIPDDVAENDIDDYIIDNDMIDDWFADDGETVVDSDGEIEHDGWRLE